MSIGGADPARRLRLDDETDEQFRRRVERMARIARLLVDAALANECVQALIADPDLPYWTEVSVRRSPPVRVRYEEATAIGDIGTCLAATRHKHWGQGPYIVPLAPDDPVDAQRILYVYHAASRYNRRFMQRQRLKELLGRQYRPLVEAAMRSTKGVFLARLDKDQVRVIRRVFAIEPGQFWRAVRGKVFLSLPPRRVQLLPDLHD